jgi:transposase InsO family protein
MSQREEFVRYYEQIENMAKACREFDITRKTGYKWWNRYQDDGLDGLTDRSRRPKTSPNKTPEETEQRILEVRESKKGDWGGRKIRRYLLENGWTKEDVPAASTITTILHRHDEIDEEESQKRGAYQRFEADDPNNRWQMDFKGHFPIEGGRCHPLTVLDDCSRFSVGLKSCLNERRETVQGHLEGMFRTYGLPEEMLTDNGKPWGHDVQHRHTKLTVWMMELGIKIRHSRPCHPETMGKDERFHRTFKDAVQTQCEGRIIEECQPIFDDWRDEYNTERPHEALDMDVPKDHYEPSDRSFPERIHDWDYSDSDAVRKVSEAGTISFQNRLYLVGTGFAGKHIGLDETNSENKMTIKFRQFDVKTLDLEDDIISN